MHGGLALLCKGLEILRVSRSNGTHSTGPIHGILYRLHGHGKVCRHTGRDHSGEVPYEGYILHEVAIYLENDFIHPKVAISLMIILIRMIIKEELIEGENLDDILETKVGNGILQSNLRREDHDGIDEFHLRRFGLGCKPRLPIQCIAISRELHDLTIHIDERTLLTLIDDDRHTGLHRDLTLLAIGRRIHQLPESFPLFVIEGIESIILNRNQNLLDDVSLILIRLDVDVELDLTHTIGSQIFEFGNVIIPRLSLVVDIDRVLIHIHFVRIHYDVIPGDGDVFNGFKFFHRHHNQIGNGDVILRSQKRKIELLFHRIGKLIDII